MTSTEEQARRHAWKVASGILMDYAAAPITVVAEDDVTDRILAYGRAVQARWTKELRDRIAAQPHEPPCLLVYGDRHVGAECSCWIGRATDLLDAELIA